MKRQESAGRRYSTMNKKTVTLAPEISWHTTHPGVLTEHGKYRKQPEEIRE